MTGLLRAMDLYNETQRQSGEPTMTIRRLARISGVPERTVYRHTRGDTTMSLQQALSYARALQCNPEDLVSDRAA